MSTTHETHFIVYVATANMPGSCKYPYDYCAVLEVPTTCKRPRAINASEVLRVVERWAPFPRKGNTLRSARGQAMAEAQELCDRMNASRAQVLPPLPAPPARDLSAVAARTCPVSGTVNHG